ncbi:F-box protein CPR1-like [Coffea arabica]|uniref:F-box protein CPR1-like n=1 Tax=Coffea arabica TaxID=13443 RepID=A0ABM4UBI3_COFAR
MDILPEDILMQILVRLPVKCLFQFKCVSKSWCSLIKSPRFTDLHVSRANCGDQEGVILVKRFIKDERKIVLSFHSKDESLSLQVVAPDFEILSFELSTEQFREIQYPDGVEDTEGEYGMQKLIVLDNSLAMIWYNITGSQISDQHFDIWVMMEYGVQESWVKKFSIGPLSGIESPLSSWNSDKLLWEMSNGQLASCAVLGDNRGSLTKYNIHGSPTTLQADIYHESLVALGELCGRRMN